MGSELNDMERSAVDRDSRVSEVSCPSRGIPSNAVHVKLCVNLSGPPDKAKYSLATDSEQVPRGKGEKNRCERSEIVPEIMCLQGVEAGQPVTACLLLNESAS